MMFQKPSVEFVEIDMTDVVVTSDAGTNICSGVAGQSDWPFPDDGHDGDDGYDGE